MKKRVTILAIAVIAMQLMGCKTKPANPDISEASLIKVDSTVGIGLLQASLNRDIPLYYDMDSKKAFDTIRFSVAQDGEQKGKFRMTTTDSLDLKPYTYYPGDSEEEGRQHVNSGLVYFGPHLTFKVINEQEGNYQVMINEETLETAVIKRDESRVLHLEGKPYWVMSHSSGPEDNSWFLYETWEAYLKRVMYVYVDRFNNVVYDSPDGNLIEKDPLEYGRIEEISGEWSRLEYPPRHSSAAKKTGWVRWTDGKKLLISPVAEVYY